MPELKRSSKKDISKGEYLALCGLLTLAQRHNRSLREIEAAALLITSELEMDGRLCKVYGGGHTADQIYSTNADADELLEKLKLKVRKK